jgi:hypothetical protein
MADVGVHHGAILDVAALADGDARCRRAARCRTRRWRPPRVTRAHHLALSAIQAWDPRRAPRRPVHTVPLFVPVGIRTKPRILGMDLAPTRPAGAADPDPEGKLAQAPAKLVRQLASFDQSLRRPPGSPPGLPGRPAARADLAPAGAAALALHRGGPRRADPCDLPHRVQRHQPGAGRGLALCRHAGGLLPRLAAGGHRRGAALHPAAPAPATPGPRYGDFAAHDGLWDDVREDPRTTSWRAWPWCHARWKRAGWTPRR